MATTIVPPTSANLGGFATEVATNNAARGDYDARIANALINSVIEAGTIQKGDVVRTRGGIIATVARVKDAEVVLRLDSEAKVELTVAKSYIDEVMPRGDTEKKE